MKKLREELTYWERFGLEPRILAELDDGSLVLSAFYEVVKLADTEFAKFTASVKIEPSGNVQAFSVYMLPKSKIKKIEQFNPQKDSLLADIFRRRE